MCMARPPPQRLSPRHDASRPHWLRKSEPGGLPSKIALAVLALVLLFALVVGILALSYVTRRQEAPTPNSYVQQP